VECQDKEHFGLQRSARAPSALGFAPPIVHEVLRSPGEPLDIATRDFMEPRFGRDFSRVRLHRDALASESAAAVFAEAFTVGRHIVFGRDAEHRSGHGKELLAHELSHVVQQGGKEPTGRIEIGAPGAEAERLAVIGSRYVATGALMTPPAVQEGSHPGAILRRVPQTAGEIRKRLEQVLKELETGSGVRTPEATAKLKAEQVALEGALRDLTLAQVHQNLAQNQREQQTGSGVRSPEAAERLRAEQAILETQARAAVGAAVTGSSAGIFRPPGGSGPAIDWQGGNLRGLGAETQVISQYPGATQLPRGFPGVDFVQGGTRTALTGFGRGQAGKLPFSGESFYIEGGSLIQLKTLQNSTARYQAGTQLYDTLSAGMNKLANTEIGQGKSEQIGNEFRRIEISGAPGRKIFHVELEIPPTPAQLAQLNRLAEEGKGYGSAGPGEAIEVVVNWPGKVGGPSGLERALAKGAGPAGIALAIGGTLAREHHRDEQLKNEGYAPVGLAAHGSDGFLVQLGAFLRGDQAEALSGGNLGLFDLPVWRNNVRLKTSSKKPGETIVVSWQFKSPDSLSSIEDVDVIYEKQENGSWRTRPPADAPAGFHPPDLNGIIDPAVSDSVVLEALSTRKSA
jgi:hypothetical protein